MLPGAAGINVRKIARYAGRDCDPLHEMLSNVEALSVPVRASGEETYDMVAPALCCFTSAFPSGEVSRTFWSVK